MYILSTQYILTLLSNTIILVIGGYMKDIINNILSKHVEVYGYVSTSEYLEKRRSLGIKDSFKFLGNLDKYKTIITLGISYPSQEVKYKGIGHGILSRYSYNLDYHVVFKIILESITKELISEGIKCHASVDISDIDERYASYLANMGFYGKNQFIINKKYGSYLYLATILIDKEISKDEVILDSCGDCRICIDACPSNALDNGFNIDLCISSITQEKKEFSDTEIGYLKTMVYGCDICQKVCPKNTLINFNDHSEFEPSGIENVDLVKLLNMSNKEYDNIYKNNASSWRGPLVIKRNALCLLGNQGKSSSISVIKKSMDKYNNVSWYNKTALKVIKILESK